MDEPEQRRLSYADYLEQERASEVRLEFIDGVALAMAGGTLRHSALKAELSRVVGNAVRTTDCSVFDSDAKVRVFQADFASYPDLSVVCGPIETSDADPHALTNPILLVEVLSDSTEAYDRGEKFRRYRALPSLRHYVLVSVHAPIIEHFARQDDGSWVLRTYTAGEQFVLDHPAIVLDVDALFENLPPYIPPDKGRTAQSASV